MDVPAKLLTVPLTRRKRGSGLCGAAAAHLASGVLTALVVACYVAVMMYGATELVKQPHHQMWLITGVWASRPAGDAAARCQASRHAGQAVFVMLPHARTSVRPLPRGAVADRLERVCVRHGFDPSSLGLGRPTGHADLNGFAACRTW